MVTTHSSVEAAELIGCTDRYLQDQVRAGRWRARKIGRNWRLTDEDIQYALDVCANKVTPVVAADNNIHVGLTPTSRRKVMSQ